MRKTIFLALALVLSAVPAVAQWNDARWITVGEGNADVPNSWVRFAGMSSWMQCLVQCWLMCVWIANTGCMSMAGRWCLRAV